MIIKALIIWVFYFISTYARILFKDVSGETSYLAGFLMGVLWMFIIFVLEWLK